MSEQTTTGYDELRGTLQQAGRQGVLRQLTQKLKEQGKFHELFEALKMQARVDAGLPLLQPLDEQLSEKAQDKLEEGLFNACREVGLALLGQGRVREGWMYLRPVGDRTAAAEALARIEPDEDNVEELVEVCLHEGVDPGRGYSLVLEHYGTCNAITTFDTVVVHLPKAAQKTAAGMLLEHLHAELTATVRADIAQQEGSEPAEGTLAELVADRDWLFGEHSYHVDTTHLASTVRCARQLSDPQQLRLALDLTAYGRRLHPQFQYQGEEPFAEIYPSHALYFQALLGEQVDEAVEYFRQKAEQLDTSQHGTIAIETYVDLLDRLGRHREAIAALRERMPADMPALGLAPTLLELCQRAGDYEAMLEQSQQSDDLLGYATGLMLRDEAG